MGEPNCQECGSALRPHWVDAEIVSYSCPPCEAVADTERAVAAAACAWVDGDGAIGHVARAVDKLRAAESARKGGAT